MREFQVSMPRLRTGRTPWPAAATPLFAELKDLDLRPHPPHDAAKHHAAQIVLSRNGHLSILRGCFKPGSDLTGTTPYMAA
jgi:hypothetical protein